jgi:hypothetical protein
MLSISCPYLDIHPKASGVKNYVGLTSSIDPYLEN